MLRRALVASFGFTLACGGAVAESTRSEASGGDGTVVKGGAGGSYSSASSDRRDVAHQGGRVNSTYVEPECPTITVPEVVAECDPLGDAADCGDGFGCYPLTRNPTGPCEAETYQMLCEYAGTRKQWESCHSPLDCAPGYSCVVTSEGNECLKMCNPDVMTSCPKGLFCDATDLQGIGICY